MKEFLSREGHTFTVRNVEDDDSAYEALLALGFRVVPVTIVERPRDQRLRRAGAARRACRRPNRDQIAQQRVRRVRQISFQLTNRDLAKQLRLEHQRVGFAVEAGEQIRGRQFDRFDRGRTTRPSASRLADATSFSRRPFASACRARVRRPTALNPGPLHRVRRRPRVEQHVRQRCRLRRGIPAVDIERGVRFGDAFRLHARQRGVERVALLHRGQDVIRRAVDDAAEAATDRPRQRLAHQIEIGTPSMTAPSNRKLTPAAAASSRSAAYANATGPLFAVMTWHPAAIRGAHVIDRRLACVDIQRRRFDDDAQIGRRAASCSMMSNAESDVALARGKSSRRARNRCRAS